MGTTSNNETKSKKDSKRKPFAGVKGFFDGLKQEFHKITWDTKENVTRETIVVVSVTIVMCVIIALLDVAIKYGVDLLTTF